MLCNCVGIILYRKDEKRQRFRAGELHIITGFMEYYEAGEVRQELKMLSGHGKDLLDALHVCQKQIDCLDYLTWQIEQDERKK